MTDVELDPTGVDGLRHAVEAAVPGSGDEVTARLALADGLLDRAENTGREDGADLDEAIYHARWVLVAAQESSPAWFDARFALLWATIDRWHLRGDRADLDHGIELAGELAGVLGDAFLELNHGELCFARYEETEDESDLRAAMDALSRALVADPTREQRHEALARLGLAGLARVRRGYRTTTTVHDLAGPIELLQDSLIALPFDLPLRNLVRYRLGEAHSLRYVSPEFEGSPAEELSEAIDHLRDVRATGVRAPEVDYELVHALVMAHDERSDPKDREDAITLLHELADDMDTAGLGTERAELLGQLYLARAVESASPDDLAATVALLEGAYETAREPSGVLESLLLESYGRRALATREERARERRFLGRIRQNSTVVVELGMLPTVTALDALATMDNLVEAREQLLAALGSGACDDQFSAVAALLGLVAVAEEIGDLVPAELRAVSMVFELTGDLANGLIDWLERYRGRLPPTAERLHLFALATLRAAVLGEDVPPSAQVTMLRAIVTDLTRVLDGPRDERMAPVAEALLGEQHVHLARLLDSTEYATRSAELLAGALATLADRPLRLSTAMSFAKSVVLGRVLGAGLPAHGAALSVLRAYADDPALPRDRRAGLRYALGVAAALTWLDADQEPDLDGPVRDCAEAIELLPADYPDRIDYVLCLATLLSDRYLLTGDLANLDAADRHLRTVRATEEGHRMDAEFMRARINQLRRVSEPEPAHDSVTILRAQVRQLSEAPEASVDRNTLGLWHAQLAYTLITSAQSVPEPLRLIREAADHTMSAERLLPANSPMTARVTYISAIVHATMATAERDRALFTHALSKIERASEHADDPLGPAIRCAALVTIWACWSVGTGDGGALDQAIHEFRLGRADLAGVSGFPSGGVIEVQRMLADTAWRRGWPDDTRFAIDLWLSTLRDTLWQVLAQSTPDLGLEQTRATADHATALAIRCLVVGEPALAVAALEVGRGLVLRAGSATVRFAELLRHEGMTELAAEWEATGGDDAPATRTAPTTPDSLRHRVLRALRSSSSATVLTGSSGTAAIAAALRSLALDVLVYLVPGRDANFGRALLVHADGRLDQILLPGLRAEPHGPVADYVRARRAADRATGADETWHRELDAIGGWAWQQAIGPLRDRLHGDTPRVVLVPCGMLGVVPWHAAREDLLSGPRYAVEDLALSYAGSAHQLIWLASRPRRRVGERPVVVAKPAGALDAGQAEARHLAGLYPSARLFGLLGDEIATIGAGTRDEILAELPTASMLHFGCHATAGGSPTASLLELASGQRLTVDRLLRRAHRGGTADGATVVLAACQTDLTEDIHDEALTLTNAFVAVGATSVIGTRWVVHDWASCALMCRFHHHLSQGLRPLDALRATQLWALDPDRPPVPGEVTRHLANVDLSSPVHWAGFTHCGW